LVPKKTSGWRLITHLSYPPSNSVNDFIDSKFTSVQYSSFDNAVSIVKKIGYNALIAKMDIKFAFRLLPCYPVFLSVYHARALSNSYVHIGEKPSVQTSNLFLLPSEI
jgi:hypothetical protein